MKVAYVLIAVVLVVAGIYFVSQRSGATEITQRGNDLTIVIDRYRLEATKVSDEYSDTLLVVGGGGESHKNLFFNSLLSVIPLDEAEALAERYGDFRKCGSPGAAAGMRSVESMVLYAGNPRIERKLKKISKLSLSGKDPIISMKFTCLEIRNHPLKENGQMMSFGPVEWPASYLVSEVELLREGMEF
jgi:hypothetical protein